MKRIFLILTFFLPIILYGQNPLRLPGYSSDWGSIKGFERLWETTFLSTPMNKITRDVIIEIFSLMKFDKSKFEKFIMVIKLSKSSDMDIFYLKRSLLVGRRWVLLPEPNLVEVQYDLDKDNIPDFGVGYEIFNKYDMKDYKKDIRRGNVSVFTINNGGKNLKYYAQPLPNTIGIYNQGQYTEFLTGYYTDASNEGFRNYELHKSL